MSSKGKEKSTATTTPVATTTTTTTTTAAATAAGPGIVTSTSNTSSILTKQISLSILQHLEEVAKASQFVSKMPGQTATIDQSEMEQALTILRKQLQVDNKNAEDVAKYGFETGLREIFQAGVAQVGYSLRTSILAGDIQELLDDFDSDPKYQRYFEKLVEKGYFKGEEAGSPEYERRLLKMKRSFVDKFGRPNADKKPPPPSKAEQAKTADILKERGNECLKNKDFQGAFKLYSEAIAADPTGPNAHIYYSNRSAALTAMDENQLALEDSLASITLNPNYPKGHSRLSACYFSLKMYNEAIECGERALKMQPDNDTLKDIIEKSKQHLSQKGVDSKGSSSASSKHDDSGDVDLSKLLSGGGSENLMQDLLSGKVDIAQMMKNPEIMKMMSDPSIMQMMQQAMFKPGSNPSGL